MLAKKKRINGFDLCTDTIQETTKKMFYILDRYEANHNNKTINQLTRTYSHGRCMITLLFFYSKLSITNYLIFVIVFFCEYEPNEFHFLYFIFSLKHLCPFFLKYRKYITTYFSHLGVRVSISMVYSFLLEKRMVVICKLTSCQTLYQV